MKDSKTPIKNNTSIYEYKQLLISTRQVLDVISLNPTYTCTNEYNFGNVRTYIDLGFFTIDEHFDKYYEKIDVHKFSDVLSLLNKAAGWEVISVTSLVSKEGTYAFLYTFKREIDG